MLSAIKNLLGKEHETSPPPEYLEEEFIPKRIENPNFLTDTAQINKLLKSIEQQAVLCTITFTNSDEEFSSSILDVKPHERTLYLDALTPDHGNSNIGNNTPLKLSTHLNGIHLAFKLTQLETYNSQGIAYYKAPFPERVFYPQRRKSLRVKPSTSHIPFSGRISKNDASLGGTVYDISRSGIGIKISNTHSRILRGDKIEKCYIMLEDYRLDFEMTVRFTKKSNSDSQPTLIGGTFEKLSNQSQKKLARFLISLEREEIRKNKS